MSGIPPPPYVHLESYQSDIKTPPYKRQNSKYGTKPQRTICCRCICCCCCSLFLIILLAAGTVYYLFTYCNPQSPTYEFFDIEVKTFQIEEEDRLEAELSFDMRFKNPNKDIEFIYCEDSRVVVIYNTTVICSGKLPAFHQVGNNVTVVRVFVKGVSKFGSGLQESLGNDDRNGIVPIDVKVTAPMRFIALGVETEGIVAKINADLSVDKLWPGEKAEIVSSKYDVVFDV